MSSEIPLIPNLSGINSTGLVRDWITNQLVRLVRNNPVHFMKMLYLESPPGYVKTATVKQIAAQLNEGHPLLRGKVVLLETVLASMTNTSDVAGTGFPVLTETSRSSSEWLVPEARDNMPRRHLVRTWTPTLVQLFRAAQEGKFVIWFFDEFNNINAQWESFFLKLAERRMGDRPLPPNFILTGAGNPQHQTIGGRTFGESMLHRMYRVDFVPDFREWRSFMLESRTSPVRHVIRHSVVNFLEMDGNKYFLNGPWKQGPHQLGYIATNPRHWTKTADLVSRYARFFPDALTPSTLRWLAERRLPTEVVRKYSHYFEAEFRSQLTETLRAGGLLRPASVSVPADVSVSSASSADVSADGTGNPSPDDLKMEVAGKNVPDRTPWDARASIMQRVEETARQHFTADLEAYERMQNLVVSHVLDSLLEPSSFQSIPYLLGGPGGGKTQFAYRSVKMANDWVEKRRQELEPLAAVSEEAAAGLKRLKRSVLLEVVLPAVPSLTELVGPVIPFNFSAKETEGMKDLEAMARRLEVAWRMANINDDLPGRYSVNTVTPFLRSVKRLAEQGCQVVVLLDELSNLSPEWEAAFLKLVERKLGSWELTEAVTFLSAGNFPTQSTYGRRFEEPTQSRLDFVHFRPNFIGWAEHMLAPAQSFEKQVAQVLVVEYLCRHPNDFYAGEQDPQTRVSPRRWKRAANWYGRMTRFYGRPLTRDETLWFLSRVLPEKTAGQFADFVLSHGKDALKKASYLWSTFGEGPAVPEKRSGQSHSDMQAEIDGRVSSLSAMLHDQQLLVKRRLSDQFLNDAGLKNDIAEHLYLDTALKAYLLDDPPPVGEFNDFLYLKSPPGYGKTSHVRGSIGEVNQIREKEGKPLLELIEIVLSNAHPSDVVGLSFPVSVPDQAFIDHTGQGIRAPGNEKLPQRHTVTTDTELIRLIENCFRAGREPVIFIDEMSNITPQWEAILLKVAEGRIGTWSFHKPVRFVTAGNPPAHSQAGREFSEVLLERLVVANYRPNFLDFVSRSESPGLDPWYRFAAGSVAGYLKLYPHHFVASAGNFTSQTRMLTPRNWTCVAEDYADLLRSHALQVGADTPEASALGLNQTWLKTYLAPHLPADAVEGFAAYLSLQSRITGDDVIVKGKSIPAKLSPEQIKVLVKSVCVSLAQHFTQPSEVVKHDDYSRYLHNFSRFIKQLKRHSHCNQELDSLFMPSLDHVKQVISRVYNIYPWMMDGGAGKAGGSMEVTAIHVFERLYRTLYDSMNGWSKDNTSPTTSSPVSSPVTGHFLPGMRSGSSRS